MSSQIPQPSCPSGKVPCSSRNCIKAIPPSALRSPIVSIQVGYSPEQFNVHKDLLTSNSSFFRSALNGCFKEALEHKVTLPEDSPDAFQAFVTFIYNGKLNEDEANEVDGKEHEKLASADMKMETLTRAWILGDKLGASTFQNLAIDLLHKTTINSQVFSHDAIIVAYSNTVEKSELRQFLVEFFVRTSTFRHMRKGLPEDFLMELVARHEQCLSSYKNRKSWKTLSLCQYYVHDSAGTANGLQPSSKQSSIHKGSDDYSRFHTRAGPALLFAQDELDPLEERVSF